MVNTTILTESNYSRLLRDLKVLIERGKARAQQAAARELVQTYWELGKRIAEEQLTENTGYDMTIYEDLAEDLNMDVSNLKQAVYFFQVYSDRVPRDTILTWSHYKRLTGIQDDEARTWYQAQAVKENWTRDQLMSAIKRDAHEDSKKKAKSTSLKIKRPTDPSYIYKAVVERVIDGDTLLLRIDLGFQVWKEQRIRLASIDCPEIDSKKGYEAFEYVRDQLAGAVSVVIQTNKIDIYGRYVAHVFYSFKKESIEKVFGKGRYLNQELVDKGLAKVL